MSRWRRIVCWSGVRRTPSTCCAYPTGSPAKPDGSGRPSSGGGSSSAHNRSSRSSRPRTLTPPPLLCLFFQGLQPRLHVELIDPAVGVFQEHRRGLDAVGGAVGVEAFDQRIDRLRARPQQEAHGPLAQLLAGGAIGVLKPAVLTQPPPQRLLVQ